MLPNEKRREGVQAATLSGLEREAVLLVEAPSSDSNGEFSSTSLASAELCIK